MHLLYKRIRNINLPLDLQFQIFDHTVLPILLYGCEIWGYENIKNIEKLHCEFLRTVTGLRKSTPLYMLYAELGRFPIEINVKTRMISFWLNLKSGKVSKLSYLTYTFMNKDTHNYKWLEYIKKILQEVGRNDLLISGMLLNPKTVKQSILQTLKDQYFKSWSQSLQLSNKGKLYYAFKNDISIENYLLNLSKHKYWPIIKFRTCNHKLPIETGRWNNLEFSERKCTICDLDIIGDEFHYLFECPYFKEDRIKYLRKYFYTRPNMHKYKELMQSKKLTILRNLSDFVRIIINKFSN